MFFLSIYTRNWQIACYVRDPLKVVDIIADIPVLVYLNKKSFVNNEGLLYSIKYIQPVINNRIACQ